MTLIFPVTNNTAGVAWWVMSRKKSTGAIVIVTRGRSRISRLTVHEPWEMTVS